MYVYECVHDHSDDGENSKLYFVTWSFFLWWGVVSSG